MVSDGNLLGARGQIDVGHKANVTVSRPGVSVETAGRRKWQLRGVDLTCPR